MNRKNIEHISKHQLFCLVMMGQIGSTNLWALGIEAKQDAWIAILISMLIGFVFIWVFTELYKNYQENNIAGTSISILGKVIGWPLAFFYALVNLFNVTRNSSEFADLINITFLQETPRIVIIFMFLATIIYISFLKLETLARVIEIILPLVLFLIILIYILIIASGRLDLKQLTPVLGNGITPVLRATYPVTINFPFGLVFIFMQFWHYTEPKSTVRKTTFLAVGISGLILAATLVIIVSALGPNLAADSTIPFLEVIKLINIADIITNMDAIGVLLIFIGGFYFAILNFLSGAMILSTLFKSKDYRWFIIPLAAFILWYVNVYEPNYPFHVKFLKTQYWQQFVPLFNIAPVLLLIILKLKKCRNRLKGSTS